MWADGESCRAQSIISCNHLTMQITPAVGGGRGLVSAA
jgi:hypothetical protein